MNKVFTLIFLVFLSIIIVNRFWNPSLVFAQSSIYISDFSSDPKSIIVKYCNLYADSVSKGIDVIQDLIGAGMVPSSYYGRTCQEETNSINHVNLTS